MQNLGINKDYVLKQYYRLYKSVNDGLNHVIILLIGIGLIELIKLFLFIVQLKGQGY